MSRGLGNDLYTSNACEDPPPPSATLQSRPEALTLPVCTMYLSLLYSLTHSLQYASQDQLIEFLDQLPGESHI